MNMFPEIKQLKEELETAKSVKVTIDVNLMAPLIKMGEVVEVEKIDNFGNLNKFDLICFYNGNEFNAYYYLGEKRNDNEWIRGRCLNNYKMFEFPIPKVNILGKIRNKKLSVFRKAYITILEVILPD